MGVPAVRRATLLVGVLALGLGPMASAQESAKGRTKWWQSERFQQQLGLTADQSARIEEVFQATLPSLRAAKAELDTLETTLSNLVADATADEAQVRQQIDRVEQSRSALSRARTLMLFRMHRILSPEQRVKFKALHEQWKQELHDQWKREPGGRGTPGGGH